MTAAEVPLTKGYVALVDDVDFAKVSAHPWHALVRANTVYAQARVPGAGKVYLHRFILGMQRGDGMQVDHIDHDGLNNTRANLRAVAPGENNRNRRGATSRSITGVLGISPHQGGFVAGISVGGRRIYIATAASAAEAARQRNDYIASHGLTHALSNVDAANLYDSQVAS